MFDSTSSLYEWLPSDSEHNFGDHLMHLIGEKVFTANEWIRIKSDSKCKYVLLGSFISKYIIDDVVRTSNHLYLVGCGYRGDSIDLDRPDKVSFIGCRGPFTSNALKNFGFLVDPIGDPAMLLPIIVKRESKISGRSIFVPHINDTNRLKYKCDDVGCDEIIQPTTRNIDDLIRLVKQISSSTFVLAGAMHAAIVAHAYGVPFAFYKSNKDGFIDCPPKWADWLSSISYSNKLINFVDNSFEGYLWWQSVQAQLHYNKLMPIIKAFSKIGQVRSSIKKKASIVDSVGLRSTISLKNRNVLEDDVNLNFRYNYGKTLSTQENYKKILLARDNSNFLCVIDQLIRSHQIISSKKDIEIKLMNEEIVKLGAQIDLLKDVAKKSSGIIC